MSSFTRSNPNCTLVGPNTGHDIFIGGIDTCMSGWGGAEGGRSFAIWACKYHESDRVMKWVESRGDIKKVCVIDGSLTTKANDHVHVYVVGPNHPSLWEDTDGL